MLMSSSVIEENGREAEKGRVVAVTEVIESRVARPSASKPCVYLHKEIITTNQAITKQKDKVRNKIQRFGID